jgi:hypothetical protein
MDIPRRIVISRKGFDSGAGCMPSPILSDGTMLSLPIPDAAGTVSYGDLSLKGHSFGKLVTDLQGKRKTNNKERVLISTSDRAHLDPDLIGGMRLRKPGWRPAYGQCGKDATVLGRKVLGGAPKIYSLSNPPKSLEGKMLRAETNSCVGQ